MGMLVSIVIQNHKGRQNHGGGYISLDTLMIKFTTRGISKDIHTSIIAWNLEREAPHLW